MTARSKLTGLISRARQDPAEFARLGLGPEAARFSAALGLLRYGLANENKRREFEVKVQALGGDLDDAWSVAVELAQGSRHTIDETCGIVLSRLARGVPIRCDAARGAELERAAILGFDADDVLREARDRLLSDYEIPATNPDEDPEVVRTAVDEMQAKRRRWCQLLDKLDRITMPLALDHGLPLHGFGLKTDGLGMVGSLIAAADSTAWSIDARRRTQKSVDRTGQLALASLDPIAELRDSKGRRPANSPEFAEIFRTRMLAIAAGAKMPSIGEAQSAFAWAAS